MTTERDYGFEAHAAAEEHLYACHEALRAEEDDVEGVDSPASAPFCGCETCEVREILFAAWPFLKLAALAGAD
jgi:hypothetical protein